MVECAMPWSSLAILGEHVASVGQQGQAARQHAADKLRAHEQRRAYQCREKAAP